MTDTGKGWFLFIAAMGMMFTLGSVEVASLHSWNEATTPIFFGKFLAHIGTVIAAFIGGKLIPSSDAK